MTALQKELEEIKAELLDLEARFAREKTEAEKDNYLSQEERDLLREISDLIQQARLQRGQLEIEIAQEELAQKSEGPHALKFASEDGESISKEEVARTLAGKPMSPEGEETGPAGDESEPFVPPTETNEPTLRKGDESTDGWVEYMQQMLNHHLGAGTVPINGKFDQATDKAVRAFQGQAGCKVDGVVGNQTWSALREDKVLAEIGTDGRAPGEFVEMGAEGRWGAESADILTYDENSDELRLVAVSVGDQPIDDFSADVFVNGARRTIKIGKPEVKSKTGSGDAHWVRVTGFAETHGTGPFKIEAYLPQELGGDKWAGELDTLPGKELGGGELTIQVNNKATGEPIEGATVVFDDGPEGFDTLEEKTDAKGQTTVYAEEGMEFSVIVKTDNDSQSRQVKMGNKNDTLVFEMDESGGELGGGELTIQVNDKATGEPIEGATVAFDLKGFDTVEDKTDAEGQTLVFIQEGDEVLITVKTGNDTQSRKVKMGNKNDTLVFEMDASGGELGGGELTIQVNDKATGEPIEGAKVIFDSSKDFDTVEETTDAKGQTVAYFEEGWAFTVTVKTDDDEQSQKVAMGDKNDTLVFKMGAASKTKNEAEVSITVVDIIDNNLPIEGAEVFIDAGSQGKARDWTDSTGVVTYFVQDVSEVFVKASLPGDSQSKTLKLDKKLVEHTFRLEQHAGGGDTYKLFVDVHGEDSKEGLAADVEISGGPPGFRPITEKNTSRVVAFVTDGEYVVSAKTDFDDQARMLTVKGEDLRHVFEMNEPGGGELTIQVNNKETGDPIEGATVVFGDSKDFDEFEQATDDKGQTLAYFDEKSTFTVTVKTDDDEQSRKVTMEDKNDTLVFKMEESGGAEPGGDVDFFFLNVQARYARSREPVADADVTISGGPKGFLTKQGKTDAKGEYSELVRSGYEYNVVVETENEVQTKTAKVDGVNEQVAIDIINPPGADNVIQFIQIIVRDMETDEPIPGASVIMKFDTGETEKDWTNDDGAVVSGPPEGAKEVTVTAKTARDKQTQSLKIPDDGKDFSFTFQMDESAGGGEIEFFRLIVDVKNKNDGQAIHGAEVTIAGGHDFSITSDGTTDYSGRFVANVGDAEYRVSVKTEHGEDSKTISMKGADAKCAFDLDEPSGDDAEDLYTLTIAVNNVETLAPIEGADVVVVGPTGVGTVTAKTDSQGKVEIKEAPSGGYVAKVSKGEDSKQDEITIVDADEALTFELTEPTNKDEPFADSVLNVFVHEAGIIEPIEGAKVVITGGPPGFGTKEAATDKMGEAKFDGCLEGDYTIMASTDHDSEKRDVHFNGIYKTYKFGLDPAPDPDGARILVNVQGDRSGDSIKGAFVEISGGPKGFKSLTTKTGGSGGVEIGALKDGTYTLKVKSESPKDEQEKSVKVAGKNQTVLFEMRETPGLKGAKLVVEVIHMSDEGEEKSVDEVPVTISGGSAGRGPIQLKTGYDGRVEFDELEEGDYDLKASWMGETQTDTVKIVGVRDVHKMFYMKAGPKWDDGA